MLVRFCFGYVIVIIDQIQIILKRNEITKQNKKLSEQLQNLIAKE